MLQWQFSPKKIQRYNNLSPISRPSKWPLQSVNICWPKWDTVPLSTFLGLVWVWLNQGIRREKLGLFFDHSVTLWGMSYCNSGMLRHEEHKFSIPSILCKNTCKKGITPSKDCWARETKKSKGTKASLQVRWQNVEENRFLFNFIGLNYM